jgi:Chromosome segregation ATPases
MKIKFIFIITVSLAFLFTSCVESSKKYRELNSQLQLLEQTSKEKAAEMEEIFSILNEVESGLRSIREAENILIIQSQQGRTEVLPGTKEQIKTDMAAISETITKYKNEIEKLKNDNRVASAQFKKRLEVLTQELDEKSRLIEDLSKQIEERETQLKIKSAQVATLDRTVAVLRSEVTALGLESEAQKETIRSQVQELNSAYYIAGTKKELIEAKVMTRGGLFSKAKVSYLAEQSSFVKIDIREVSEINLNTQRAKILTTHPAGTYYLYPDANGMQVLKISNTDSFWEHTKYLVIQSQ